MVILSDGFDIKLQTDADNEKTNYLEDYSNFKTLSMVAEDRVKYGDKQWYYKEKCTVFLMKFPLG